MSKISKLQAEFNWLQYQFTQHVKVCHEAYIDKQMEKIQARLAHLEEDAQTGEAGTYPHTVYCSNCKRPIDLRIPKTINVAEWIIDDFCPFCESPIISKEKQK